MSIKEYTQNNAKRFEVYVNLRSKSNPADRYQKRVKEILTRSKAQAIHQELMKEAFAQFAQNEVKVRSLGTIVAKWFEAKRKDHIDPIGEDTLNDYHKAILNYLSPYLDRPYSDLKRSEIKALLHRLDDLGKSKSFQAKIKLIINGVYCWAIEEGVITDMAQSPAHGIKINRRSEKAPLILTRKEIVKLLDAASFYKNPWQPIWSVALLTGCRNGELFALTWDDIDFENNIIRVSKSYNKRHRETKATKGGYWRTVPINSDLRRVLLELRSVSKTKEVLPRLREWCQGNQAKELRVFCVSIGITPVSFHTLRACFATQLLQNGVPPATVMKICGWKDLDVMTRYIRLAGIDESGATDSLKLLTPTEAMDKVVNLFRRDD